MKKKIIQIAIVVVIVVCVGLNQGWFNKKDLQDFGGKAVKTGIKGAKKGIDELEKVATDENVKKAIGKGVDAIEEGSKKVKEEVKNAFGGNQSIDSFNKSKKMLLKDVYNNEGKTLYCGCDFNKKDVNLSSCGYKGIHEKMKERAKKIEWEHVVPAENFGKGFIEWREGHKSCVDSKGRTFKGRKCAEKANKKYRYMQADMYNLFPAIGEVNGVRSNLDHGMIAGKDYQTFGKCGFKYSKSEKKTEPRNSEKGIVARTYLYMEGEYGNILSKQNKKLYEAWDKQFGVTDEECRRYNIIKEIQGNENPILKDSCSTKQIDGDE